MALNKGYVEVDLEEVKEQIVALMREVGKVTDYKTPSGYAYALPELKIRLYVYSNDAGKISALYFNYEKLQWKS